MLGRLVVCVCVFCGSVGGGVCDYFIVYVLLALSVCLSGWLLVFCLFGWL